MEKDGLTMLADWLEQMPDKTFPNQKIVMTILNCVDRLILDERHMDKDISGELQQYLMLYKLEAPSGYKEC